MWRGWAAASSLNKGPRIVTLPHDINFEAPVDLIYQFGKLKGQKGRRPLLQEAITNVAKGLY